MLLNITPGHEAVLESPAPQGLEGVRDVLPRLTAVLLSS